MRSRRTTATTACATLALGLAACSGTSSPEPRVRADESSTVTTAASCPNSYGGRCLGPLPAGEHTTSVFQPQLTYTVDEGWENQEDLPGNFLLLPPGADLGGVDAGTSDYVGVYTTVRASGGCRGEPGPAGPPRRVAAAIRSDPDLRVSNVGPTEVGGLRGLVMDIEMDPDPSSACPSFGGGPAVPLLVGVHATSMDHAMIEGLTMRLYLLARGRGTLAIEVDDVHGGRHLDDYSSVVKDLRFAE